MEILLSILGAIGASSVTSAITSEVLARKHRAATVGHLEASTAEIYERIASKCAEALAQSQQHHADCLKLTSLLHNRLEILEKTVNGTK